MKTPNTLNKYFSDPTSCHPVLYRLSDEKSRAGFEQLLDENRGLAVIDGIESQLRELIKSLHPSEKIKDDAYPALIEKHLDGQELATYGVWVYYPWSGKVVHLLDEEEFVEVRTNRNRYKITREEQAALRNKKIGIIGLSVGQSIALTLALERVCGELRLADFDTAELSNLNRIRTGVHNLGLKKTVIAAREIAEIDPFIKVKLFSDGITKENSDRFFIDEQGKLDLLVEVCDGMDIKIFSRFKARELGVPVVMDTNDRGMLDIERFDLEPNRAILHGLAEGLDPENIKNLTNEQKIPYILRIIGGDQLSSRLKASMIEVEQSINTWPQLASSVTLGGAITTDVVRRILLDQFRRSGRYYVDVEALVGDSTPDKSGIADGNGITWNPQSPTSSNPYRPLDDAEILAKAKLYVAENQSVSRLQLGEDEVVQLVEAARRAPSAGNNQPWKWVVHQDMFFLFHDKHRSYSWGDFDEIGSHTSLGTAIESLSLKAISLGMESKVHLYPRRDDPFFTAAVSFGTIGDGQANKNDGINGLLSGLAPYLEQRMTNRKLGVRQQLPEGFYEEMREIVQTIPGADIQYVDDGRLELLGEVISACDRERLLYQKGHEEFFHEIRWTPEEAEATGDGIDLALVDLTNSEKAGFRVARDWEAIAWLDQWDKGRGFQKMSRNGVAAASSMVLFTIPNYDKDSFIQIGRAVMRAWLFATKKGVSVHPMLSPVFFFNRLKYGDEKEMTPRMIKTLTGLRADYEQCFQLNEGKTEAFLIKLAIADTPSGGTYRLPTKQIFQIDN